MKTQNKNVKRKKKKKEKKKGGHFLKRESERIAAPFSSEIIGTRYM